MMGGFGGITGGLHMLVPLLYWGGLVGLMGWVMAEALRGGGETGKVESGYTEELLHARFARGEIDAREYERALEVLRARCSVVNDGS
ncbi:MAG: SHOCT domain-containing protein [Rubrobacteraceae bacterium]